MSRLKFLTAAVLLALAGWAAAFAVSKPEGPPAATPAPPVPSPTSIRKFEEYGDISFSDEKARLDNFAVELLNTPEATGYVIAYGGQRGRAGEARRRIERASRYLVAARKVPAARLVTFDGGYREVSTVELYVFPPDAAPAPTLLASPTVDPTEVEIIKGKPARRGRGARPP